jgi:hypothetical protein
MPPTTRSKSISSQIRTRTIKKPAPENRPRNVPDGVHKVNHNNGNTYYLPMRNGRIHGTVRWEAHDHRVEAEYKDGKQHGFERVRWNDNATAEAMFVDGIKEGVEIKRTATGTSVCIGHWVGGVMTGPAMIYHNLENGIPMVKLQNFKDDEREGPHAYVTWNQHGDLANDRLQRLVPITSAQKLPTVEEKREAFGHLSGAIENAKEEMLTGVKYLEVCNASKAVHELMATAAEA